MTVPWYELERELLGDRERVPAVAGVAEARRLLRSADPTVPDLPETLPEDSGLSLPPSPVRSPNRARWGLLVLAVVLGLLVVRWPPGETRFKGGELVVTVDRDRAGVVTSDAATFQDGDRLQLRLTTPPGVHRVRVWVMQGGAVVLDDGPFTVRGGNRVPLPFSFAVDGAAIELCVSAESSAEVTCRRLQPQLP